MVIVNVYVWFIKQHPLYGLINCLYSVQKHLTMPKRKQTVVMQTHKHRHKQCNKKKLCGKKKEREDKPHILINGTNTSVNHFLRALHSSLSAAL